MDEKELVRYHTLDGTFTDMRPSTTGAFVLYAHVKELVLSYLAGINRMMNAPGHEGEAEFHNECIHKIAALFEEHDPIDDEIKELEQKLNELKERKNEKKRY